MNAVHFSSERTDWETPQRFFDALDAEFGFTLDACASKENTKCSAYFTIEQNALQRSWGGVVFMNPPYGYSIRQWIGKAYRESQLGSTVVCLIPAKTETSWFHDYVMKASEIRLIRGRMRFSGHEVNAPFPSCVVVFRPGVHVPTFSAIDRLL